MSIKDGILDLTIKKYWFDKICSGEKTHEYRDISKWRNKLGQEKWKQYAIIRFRNGQTVKSTDKNRVVLAEIISVKITDGNDSDLKINRPVYDIEFRLPKAIDIRKDFQRIRKI